MPTENQRQGSGWENECQKHTHKHKQRHTNWQAEGPSSHKGEWVAQGEVGNHSGAVQKRHFPKSTHHYNSFRLIECFFFLNSFYSLLFVIKALADIVSLGLAITVAINMQSLWSILHAVDRFARARKAGMREQTCSPLTHRNLNPFLCVRKDANIKAERTRHHGCARAQCLGCSSSFCRGHSLSNRIIFWRASSPTVKIYVTSEGSRSPSRNPKLGCSELTKTWEWVIHR